MNLAPEPDRPPAGPALPADPQRLRRRANELYHNFQAAEFDRIHRFRHRAERRFWLREVVPRLAAERREFGVDLCTGTGFVPRALLEHLPPAARVLCLDLSEEALARARSYLAGFQGRVSTRVTDAEVLPVKDASADWVSLNAGLHHVPDPPRVLREIDRVLKPGGLFCLGHEPNAAFFASRGLVALERAIWHAFWYASPRRNLERLRRRLGRPSRAYEAAEHLGEINALLLAEGLIGEPLSLAALRQLVDVHAHGEGGRQAHGGFRPRELLRACFPRYRVERLLFSDFGGEMLSRHPALRRALDGLMGALFREKGRLFSWIIRKPSEAQGGPE